MGRFRCSVLVTDSCENHLVIFLLVAETHETLSQKVRQSYVVDFMFLRSSRTLVRVWLQRVWKAFFVLKSLLGVILILSIPLPFVVSGFWSVKQQEAYFQIWWGKVCGEGEGGNSPVFSQTYLEDC